MSLLPPIFTLFPYTTLFRSYTLTAGASGVSGGTSAAFSVTAGAPSALVFSVQPASATAGAARSEEHTSELQSHSDLVCRLLLEKKKNKAIKTEYRSEERSSK